MSCSCTFIPIILECSPSVNDVVNSIRIKVNGNDKKFLKLLLKQYEIESVTQEEPEQSDDGFIVRKRPLIVTYFNPFDPLVKFKWSCENYDIYED